MFILHSSQNRNRPWRLDAFLEVPVMLDTKNESAKPYKMNRYIRNANV